jgi:hypothetical protein
MPLRKGVEFRGPEEIDHLAPDAGPSLVESAGCRAVADIPGEDAVALLDELLDRFERLVEAELRGRAREAETATCALSRLDRPRPRELSEQLGQVVGRCADLGRDDTGVREDALRQGGKEGKGLEGMGSGPGKDVVLL